MNAGMQPGKVALYRMQNNAYLGDCICAIYLANDEQIRENGLTGCYVSVYIKTPQNIRDINLVESFEKGEIFEYDKDVLLRVASECELGVFGDSHCDCESQRIACLNAIRDYGQGIYVQMPQEGQGRGLFYKAQELELQVHGATPDGEYVGPKNIYEASKILSGHDNIDIRSFNILKDIFDALGIGDYKYTLVSSNPKKADELSRIAGVEIIGSKNVQREINVDNVGEYLAKIYKKDFALSDEELHEIYTVLFNTKSIPNRTLSLLKYIEDDLGVGKQFNVNTVLLQKIASLHHEKSDGPISDILNVKDSEHYREHQVELKVDSGDIGILASNEVITNFISIFFEENYFYDLVYFQNAATRDLKIRRKSRVNKKHEVVESRLIYKVMVEDGIYDIRNIAIGNKEISELLTASLQDYEAHYVPVFTHTCEVREKFNELTVLIKRYSSKLRTLSIMGDNELVEEFIDELQKLIEVRRIPDPTNIRTIDEKLNLDFDYDKLAKEEMELFKKYYKG